MNFFYTIQIIRPFFYPQKKTFSKSGIKMAVFTKIRHPDFKYERRIQNIYVNIRALLCDNQVIVLLTLLNENILIVEQILGIDYLVKGCKFLLIDRNTTTLDKLAHLAL